MVRLFGIAVALQEQEQAFVPGGFAGAKHVSDARRDGVPDLGPHSRCGLPERPRVLRPERLLRVSVVVEERQLGSPAEPHRIARAEHEAQHRAQACRPSVGVAQRCLGPVLAPDQRRELLVARIHSDLGGHLQRRLRCVRPRGQGNSCGPGLHRPAPKVRLLCAVLTRARSEPRALPGHGRSASGSAAQRGLCAANKSRANPRKSSRPTSGCFSSSAKKASNSMR